MNELILLRVHPSLMSMIILRLEYVVDQCFDHFAWTSASSQETGESQMSWVHLQGIGFCSYYC